MRKKFSLIFVLIIILLSVSQTASSENYSIGGRGLVFMGEEPFLFAGPALELGLFSHLRLRGTALVGSIEENSAFKFSGNFLLDFNPGGFNPYLGTGFSYVLHEDSVTFFEILAGAELRLNESLSAYGEGIFFYPLFSIMGILGGSLGISYSF